MSDFDGEVPTGTWHLYVNDLRADMMAGALNGWSLIFDTDDLCHGRTCDEPLPGDVGNTLTLEKLGGRDLRLSWGAVADAAGYVVRRAPRATMDDEETVGETASTSLDEIGLPETARMLFYQVRAHNACHDEGP
jgi:hypothetical protein